MYAGCMHLVSLVITFVWASVLCATAFDVESIFGLAADQLFCTGCQSADICHACNDHLALQMHVACLNDLLPLSSAYFAPCARV